MKKVLLLFLLLFFIVAEDNTSLIAHIDKEIAELNKELFKLKEQKGILQKKKDVLFASYEKHLDSKKEGDPLLEEARQKLFKIILEQDDITSKLVALEFQILNLDKKKDSLINKNKGLTNSTADVFAIKKIKKENAEKNASILSSKLIDKFGSLSVKDLLLSDSFIQIENEIFSQLNKNEHNLESVKWDFIIKEETIKQSDQSSSKVKVVPFLKLDE